MRKKKNVLVNGGSKIITALFYVSVHSGHFLKRFIFLGHLHLYLFFGGWQGEMTGNYELKNRGLTFIRKYGRGGEGMGWEGRVSINKNKLFSCFRAFENFSNFL